MKAHRVLITITLAAIVLVGPVEAHHVIWLDFSDFDLDAFTSVNGNSPPTAADVSAVRKLVIANMVEDYALFDVYFTTFEPANGRYTRIRILGTDMGGLYGCAGPGCCPSGGTCTGIGSWDDMKVSAAEVYAGSFSDLSVFSGSNATTTRIANGISHTASHELGHILDLEHFHAADDAITLGCSNATCPGLTNDQNPTWHIMASGSSWGLTPNQRATRDRFFSIHASRRILYGNFQALNHWATLGNLNGGVAKPLPPISAISSTLVNPLAGRSDLAYGRIKSPSVIKWYARLSTGTKFGPYSTWRNDAGNAGDIFFTADIGGDGDADLVYGRILSSTQIKWFVRYSTGSSFGSYYTLSNDAGNAGDIFRLADVNGDGRDDLVYGRPLSSTQIKWYVRLSTGSNFGPYQVWRNDAGNEGDIFLLGDVDKDGDADLVYGRTLSDTQVKWYARLSTGSSFGSYSTWRNDAGNKGDIFYLGDVGGDGDADLVYGRTLSDGQVKWYVRYSFGSSFGAYHVWRNDAGNAGDLFRLGDGNGDGRLDLFYARPTGMTSLTTTPNLGIIRWYGRLSLGGSFGNYTVWRSDAGNEGDIFP